MESAQTISETVKTHFDTAGITNMKVENNSEPYSKRIAQLRTDLLAAKYEADIERARYYTRSYKQTEGEPSSTRAAKGLAETLKNMSIKIDDNDHFVGLKTIKLVACPLGVERTLMDRTSQIAVPFHGKDKEAIRFLDDSHGAGPDWLEELLKMPDEEVREMQEEIIPYWKERNLHNLMHAKWKMEGLLTKDTKFPMLANASDMQGHVTIGLKKVLDIGFGGIADQAKGQLSNLKESDDQYEQRKDFLESVLIATDAVCDFSERYALLAEKLAQNAEGERKQELMEIADRCHRVPYQPPKSFMDAIQATWMTQVVLAISYGEDAIFAPGRVDQYLYPYYQKDLQNGLITREVALEAIEEYLIKLSTFTGFGPNNVTIGGISREGEDAVNEISYIFLEAYNNLKGLRNGLAVRISEKTPRDFLIKACEVHRRTSGVAFYNDEKVISDLMMDEYPLEDTRDYGVVGCAELTSTGNNNGYTSGSTFYFQTTLEMALHEGCRYMNNWQQVGVKTPPASSFKSFEDVKKAFKDQLANSIAMMVKLMDAKDQVFAEYFPTPLLSSTIEGCIESGLDITQGGARYNHSTVSAQGVATVANSLAAIQWAVFEEKIVTMEELVGHLRNNFKDAEELRQQLIRKAPKYGNNDPKVDEITLWVLDQLDKEARKHRRVIDGGPYRALMISAGGQVLAGRMLGATPDGRLAGEPLANGMSPSNGTDRNGMTAVLNSAAKVSVPPLSSGTIVNMVINPLSIKTDESLNKFGSLIEGYFNMGGRQVQFNPMGREMLLDAQKNPDNYSDLMVKVSGYSYRFVDLSKGLQNDIINRTEFDV